MAPNMDRSLVTSSAFLLVAAGRTAQRRLDDALGERGLALRHIGALGHLARRPDLLGRASAIANGPHPAKPFTDVMRLTGP